MARSAGGRPATVASAITTTTPTTSSVIQFTGVDTAASKTDWDGAVVRIYFDITRNKGGDSLTERVFAAQITGTYTVAATPVRAAASPRFRSRANCFRMRPG